MTRITAGMLVLILIGSCASKQFRIALLPDTQSYSRAYPEIFRSQTRWIADHADSISFVLHQGDITDHNVPEQWNVAQSAMNLLDGKVPYVMAMGNHDYGTNGRADVRNADYFNDYFPYAKLSRQAGFGGTFESGKMENSWHVFRAGGLNWLILSLEFGPRNKVLEWAAGIIREHPRHKVIVNTHAYMYADDTRMGPGDKWLPGDYGLAKNAAAEDQVNNGEEIWEKLVSQHPNMLFVFSGHVLNKGAGKLVSEGKHGNKVYQMLANYQGGVKGSENGGNGFLRLITVNPRKGTVEVKTYSPHLNQYKTEPDHQFTFENIVF